MATASKKTAAPTTPAKTVATKKVVAKTAAPQKPVTTPAAKKTAAKKVTAPDVKLKASTAPKPLLTAEQRNHYVAVAAFYIAERRGFTLGNPQEDWIAAEAEIDRLIASGHFSF